MEEVKVMTYLEASRSGRRYGAAYLRSSGERIKIASGLRRSDTARELASEKTKPCTWEAFEAREANIVDVGTGWVD